MSNPLKDIKCLQSKVCSIQTTLTTTPDTAKLAALIEYADNAAAVTAGLVVGDLYRTADVLKVVHA